MNIFFFLLNKDENYANLNSFFIYIFIARKKKSDKKKKNKLVFLAKLQSQQTKKKRILLSSRLVLTLKMATASSFEGDVCVLSFPLYYIASSVNSIYGDSDDEKGGKAEETTSKQVSEAVDFGEEKVEPSPAFQRFSGRAAEGAQADTTAIRGLAEIIDTGDKREAKYEYPLQKYTRLKDEVFELEHQLKQLSQS
ncbi:hypothetical protein RFI_30676, partial [Reticulomyxa filosa]